MNELLAFLVPALGRALLHFLWQGALIGMIAALLLHALRDARPQVRYAVACVAMLACALAPILGIAWTLMQRGEAAPADIAVVSVFVSKSLMPASFMPVIATASKGLAAWPFDAALPSIVAIWASGACALSLRMATGVWWIQRLCAAPQDASQAVWQVRLDDLAPRLGMARQVSLRLVESLATPAAVGWFRPVVLLPVALISRMPVSLIEALLAHELAHIRRHDYLVNLLQGAVEAMLFYHPVTWWLSRRIRIEREHIADRLAAEAIGEPRRLALALSELSELSSRNASIPATPSLAMAAQGGHLMSRIEQLVRPGLRRSGGRIAFPLIGLVAASLAFYAHAQIDGGSSVTVSKTEGDKSRYVLRERSAGETYALVRKGHDGITMSGSTDDIDDIKAARSRLGSDFVWFRKGKQAYVVVDPATNARVQQAWAETDKLSERMEALGAQMEVHGHKMEALGKQMEKLSDGSESPAMEAASDRMEALGRQQEELGAKQAALAEQMAEADANRQDALSRQMDELSKQQEALSAQMHAQSQVMEAESARMEERMKPMEALSRQMDEAGKPMDALGKQMDAMGEEMDRLSAKAEHETLRLIDEAVAKGLAQPAPVR